MTTLAIRKVRSGGLLKLTLVPVVRREVRGGVGVLKLQRVRAICPACGEQVEAVATDGRVKGYCAVAKQSVDFLIEAQGVPIGKGPTAEARAKISAATKKLWQDPEYRAKLSAARTGKYPTDETRAKIAAALTSNKKGG